VTIRRGFCDRGGSDRAAGAGPVVDDHGLRPAFGETLRHQAGDVVGGAASNERNHKLDRFVRIVLRRGRRFGNDGNNDNARSKQQMASHDRSLPNAARLFSGGHVAFYSRSAAATSRNYSNSNACNGMIPVRCKSATSGKNAAGIGELLTLNACWFPRADVENA
jgi:hypothetical protein